jgi:hypothetical protein
VVDEFCPNSNLPLPPEGVSGCTKKCPDGSVIAYNANCPIPPPTDPDPDPQPEPQPEPDPIPDPKPNGSPMISLDKSVSNLTQNIEDANNTKASPGDRLKYTIHIYNYGDAPANNLKLDGEYGESINDILEYSDIVDLGDANFNNQTNFLTWNSVNVPVNGHIQKSFIVQVKNPLPSTPVSASDPLSYDYMMHNKYGRLVTIKLDKSTAKIVELGVTTLPNTGPGTSMIIVTILFATAGYFYYRSRLMAKELSIIHKDYSSGCL